MNQSYGIFAIERFVRSRIEVEAGLRLDNKDLQSYYYIGNVLQSPQLNFQNLSYNLGAIYKPLSFMKFNLNLANGWRAPAVNELYSDGLHHGVAAIERGDKNLKTEYCLNAIGGVVIDHKKFRAEATAYAYEFENYIYYNPSNQPELTIRGAFPVFNYTQNNASIRGGDMLLNYQPIKHLEVKARAMWVRGRNKDLNIPLIYMPSDRYETSIAFKFGDIKLFKESYLEPTFQFVDKQYRVPVNSDFVAAPDAYYLFGLNAGTTIQLNKQPLILTFSINNAANSVYRDYLDRFRYYNDAPGVNYTLRLRVPFVLYDKH
jgi:iron complex outermembrane receptor protein